LFIFSFQFSLKLVSLVEVIFDCTFATACDKNHFSDASGHGFFNGVLNQWLINHIQHFFGARFGRWQKSCAKARNRENRFSDSCIHIRMVNDLIDYSVFLIKTQNQPSAASLESPLLQGLSPQNFHYLILNWLY
jgi:hypothetical protein